MSKIDFEISSRPHRFDECANCGVLKETVRSINPSKNTNLEISCRDPQEQSGLDESRVVLIGGVHSTDHSELVTIVSVNHQPRLCPAKCRTAGFGSVVTDLGFWKAYGFMKTLGRGVTQKDNTFTYSPRNS